MSNLNLNSVTSLDTGREVEVSRVMQTVDYVGGLVIDSLDTVVVDGDDRYALTASTVLPYTTTGAGMPEGGAFVSVGDAALRQELADPDKGAAMVARGVVAVDSIADLLALPEGQRLECLRYLVSGDTVGSIENGGAFYWTNSDISAEVSDDPDGGFYIAPAESPTGADGGWVRFMGTYAAESFPQAAPSGSELYLKTLGRTYYRVGGEWSPIDDYLLGLLDAHVQSRDAHGLQDARLYFGEGAEALGQNPVAIGKNVKVDSAYSVGRDNFTNSPFSSLFGRNLNVTVSDIVKHRSNIAIGSTCTLTDTSKCVVLGDNSTATGNGGIAIGTEVTISDRYPIGIGASATATGESSVAIGKESSATHGGSVAIGHLAKTTALYQIVLGRAAHTVIIPGNLNVEGTKNFSIPHPVPEKATTHRLVHSAYEGPCRGGTIYRLRVHVTGSQRSVDMPDYYKHLNEGGDVFVNAVGHFGVGYGEVSGNCLTIHVSTPGEYVVMVMAERKDPAAVAGWKGAEVENGHD